MKELRKNESGVTFVFDADRAVDGDAWLDSVTATLSTDQVTSCDFIWRPARGVVAPVLFIEVKSSSPKSDLTGYCRGVVDKFIVTAAALLARHAGRLSGPELPAALEDADAVRPRWRLVLLIPSHETTWLPPLRDALRRTLQRSGGVRHVLRLDPDPLVLNRELAQRNLPGMQMIAPS